MSQQSKVVDLSLAMATNVVKLQTKLLAQNANQHVIEQAVISATLLGETVYTAMATTNKEERDCLLQDGVGDITRLEYWLKLLVQIGYVSEIESRPYFFDLKEIKKLIEDMLS